MLNTTPLKRPSLWIRFTSLLGDPTFKTVVFFLAVVIMIANFALPYILNLGNSTSVDFPSFYYGAKAAFQTGQSPYRPGVWKIMQQSYTDGRLFPYLYTPPSLFIFFPFSLLDYQPARLAMLVLNFALILTFLLFFLFKIIEVRPSDYFSLFCAIYLFWFDPLGITVKNGQVNLMVLLVLCLTWYAMKKRAHPIWIAIPLSIGIILKLYPILFLAIPFVKKEFKTIAWVSLFVLGASLLAQFVLHSGIWQDWYTYVAVSPYGQIVRGLTVSSSGNQSVNGFFARLFFGAGRIDELVLAAPDWLSSGAPYLTSGIILLVSLWVTYLSSQKAAGDSALDLQFPLWLLAMYLVAPLSWNHFLVVVLPAIYVALKWALTKHEYTWLVFLGAISVLLAWPYPYNDPAFRHGLSTLLVSAQFFGVFALWLFYIRLNLISRNTAEASIPDRPASQLPTSLQSGSKS